MDWLSHILINNLVFKELPQEKRVWAIFLGIAPDIFSFAGIYRLEFFKKMLFFKKIPASFVPHLIFRAYNIGHSVPIWLAVFLILWLAGWQTAAIVWSGWLIHIFLDIFTHSPASVTQTRPFWPLSKWSYSGFTWSTKKFLLAEYAILAIFYLIFYF
jgi:hypothetical protein